MAFHYSPKISTSGLDYYLDFSNKKSYNPNLLNYSNWIVGSGSIAASSSLYGVSQYDKNGSTEENIREIGLDPFGDNTVLWVARNNDVASNNDGGWNTSLVPVDNTKMYRFSVWVNREVLGNGSFYFGLYSTDSEFSSVYLKSKLTGLAYSTTINPYFTLGGGLSYLGSFNNNWALFVGHLWPVNSATGSNHIDSGCYTRELGKISDLTIVSDRGDFIQVEESAYVIHRSYLYYSTDPTTVQKWCYPRIDLIDGNEPSIQDLLNSSDPIRDLSRNGITQSVEYNSGLSSDGGMVFNTNNQINTNYSQLTTNSTYEVWCKLTNYSNSYNMVFGSTLPYLSFNSSGFFLYSNRFNSVQRNTVSNTPWVIDTIYHITCTTDYVGTQSNVKIYINGNLDNQGTYDGFYTNPGISKIVIGDGRETNWYPFSGIVYSFKVYNRSLSSSEVFQNYNTHKSKFGY